MCIKKHEKNISVEDDKIRIYSMNLALHPALLSLWERCRAFVEDACRGRGPSHGLDHMQQVTTDALMLYTMCPPCEKKAEIWTSSAVMNDFTDRMRSDLPSQEAAPKELVFLPSSPFCSLLCMYRIILAAMLHDVADHKYDDAEGGLEKKLQQFARSECERLFDIAAKEMEEEEKAAQDGKLGGTTATSSLHNIRLFSPIECIEFLSPSPVKTVVVENELQQLLLAIAAISFSKEKKLGKNWFSIPEKCTKAVIIKSGARAGSSPESATPSPARLNPLTPSWLIVRHVVSDGDKLHALGEEGLIRCYTYTCEVAAEKYTEATSLSSSSSSSSLSPPFSFPLVPGSSECNALEKSLLDNVEAHFEEKLSILSRDYMRTTPGKQMSHIKEREMIETLKKWRATGPPSVVEHWPAKG